MTNNATKQYNGIILLTGYLQRLFVAETIYERIGEHYDPERMAIIHNLLDETYKVLPVFEQTHTLTETQKVQLQVITEQVEQLMQSYFKPMAVSFNYKLAIVGSSLYAEQKVNAGIIRLGEVFKVEVNRDFHQRVKFYEQRTKMIDYLVGMLHQKKEIEEQFMKPVDPWFDDVMRNKDYILSDMKQIGELIEF
ncbi:hypothetical protein SAMN05880501_104250 [Ureibacillus xyleni]|uniref:Uncharacterized protein n=1 Tax=Ureibacillus xyleni TaxID=614648 RepID=A0A285SEM0_9BACL|nr:transcriptional regulator [Ureibacillus xyleni]SOC06337.1 hypothetical protein SAMN05880501_104250 [Ureibacillus xyleni]